MRTSAALVAVIGIGLARPADADNFRIRDLPARCHPFTTAPTDPRAAWNQVVSLASCVEDASTVHIIEADDLSLALDDLDERLRPALAAYAWAVADAPVQVKIAAAYHIGLAEVALMTRARNSIASPTDIGMARFTALHAELEQRLAPYEQIARAAFQAVDRGADQDPELVDNPVLAHDVAEARRLLAVLPLPGDTQHDRRADRERDHRPR